MFDIYRVSLTILRKWLIQKLNELLRLKIFNIQPFAMR